jgi:type I restriction enzyme S subunit
MEFKTLKQIATLIRTGKTPPTKEAQYFDGNINWYGPPDLGNGKFLGDAKRTISVKAIKEKKAIEFPANTLLIGCIGDIGKLGITTNICSSNQQLTGILPNEQADVNYLYYWFRHSKQLLESYANKAVVPILNNGTLEKIPIPLPPLEQQKKIAAILDAADAYRQKTKELIAKYDELTQSLFLDMFGDPVKNEKGWEKKDLKEVCTKITDGTHDTPKRLLSGIKFITGKHIRPFEIDYLNSDYVTEEVHKEIYKRCNPEFGDILYTNIGVNFATAAMNTVDYEFSMKNVALLKYKRDILNGRFLESILNDQFFKDRLKMAFGIGGAQQFLSLSNIKSITVLCPPLSLQNQFAERVQAIEVQKAQAQASLVKAEELFNSLLQKAFNGEIV